MPRPASMVRWAIVAALVIAGAAAALVLRAGTGREGRAPGPGFQHPTGEPSPTIGPVAVSWEAVRNAWARLPPGWSALPAPPFADSEAVSVWTGRELVYWAGRGAAFDPVSGEWRALPEAPIETRSEPAVVWTGREVLIWGGYESHPRGDGAALDLSTGVWRTLPPAPLSARVPVAVVWTGSEMIVWGDASRSARSRQGAAYDPADDRWRPLARAPFSLNLASGVWTGQEMVVYGAQLDANNLSTPKYARGLAYDPTEDRWRVLPTHPLSPQASAAVWTGEEVLVYDYELHAGAYDPATGRWRRLPRLPLRFFECYPEAARVPREVVAWYCGQVAAFDLRLDRWRPASQPGDMFVGASFLSTGQAAVVVGRSDEGEPVMWAYRPRSPGGAR